MKNMNQAAKYGSQLLSPYEAASYLNVSARTLANWRCIGTPNIPYSKVGRCVRYRIADLDTYVAKHSHNVEV